MWEQLYTLILFVTAFGLAGVAIQLRSMSLIRGLPWLISIFLVASLWALATGLYQFEPSALFQNIALISSILYVPLLAQYVCKSRQRHLHFACSTLQWLIIPLVLYLSLSQSALSLYDLFHSIRQFDTTTLGPQIAFVTWYIALSSLILWQLFHRRERRSMDNKLVMIAISAPLIAQLLDLLAPYSHAGEYLPIAPLALGISLVATWVILGRHHTMGLGPMSRNAVVDQVDMGIVILNRQGRILDCSAYAIQLLRNTLDLRINKGSNLCSRLTWLPDLQLLERDFRGLVSHESHQIDYQIKPICSALGDQEGWLLTLRDISTEAAEKRILEEKAYTDALTGLCNRANFTNTLDNELLRFSRYGQSFALLLMDLDHFKKINDTYGHLAGDACLRQFSDLCKQFLREVDVIGRIGGEEFAALLPLSDTPSAYAAAERLRRNIERNPVFFDGQLLRITVSMGLARPIIGDTAPEQILGRADQALYKAKNNGRNRVEICPESTHITPEEENLQIPMALS